MSSLGSGRVSGSLRGRFFIFSGVTNTINTLSQCIVYMYQHCIKHIKHTNKHTNFCCVTNTNKSLPQCIVYMHQPCKKHIKHTNKHTNLCGVTNTINTLSQYICALTLHKKASEHISQKSSHCMKVKVYK